MTPGFTFLLIIVRVHVAIKGGTEKEDYLPGLFCGGAHVDHIQMTLVPSELYINIQSDVVCRCIKEEDDIYH